MYTFLKICTPFLFQHTATRRWLLKADFQSETDKQFQHTATRRWLLAYILRFARFFEVSTHSHPKVAAYIPCRNVADDPVSTHSHPKVAATIFNRYKHWFRRFNTQPPEGGCNWSDDVYLDGYAFQHTATRRWLQYGCPLHTS